jgi:hypothetical protein
MAGVGKKGPPKRNTGLWRALYAPRFTALLEIGACCGAGLPSVGGFYDGGGRRGYSIRSEGKVRDFQRSFR